MKVLFSLLVVGLLAGSKNSGHGQDRDKNWIDVLKKTPAAKLEAGLPAKPFQQWLAEQTHAARPEYQLDDCESGDSAPPGKCIKVTASAAPMRRVELTFTVPAKAGGTSGEAGLSFVRGTIGPADQRSKQPTRLIRKLSELEAMLR